jgi:hypothetical protein
VVRGAGSRAHDVASSAALYSRCAIGGGWYAHSLKAKGAPVLGNVKSSVAIGGEMVIIGGAPDPSVAASVDIYEAAPAVIGQ